MTNDFLPREEQNPITAPYMKEEQREWFEKGRVYEREYAKQLAEERMEAILICLLERAMHGEGEMFIPDLDLQLANTRFVTFMTKDNNNIGLKIKLVKEPLTKL